MVSGHHIRLIQVSNFLDLNIYAKTPWGPRVGEPLFEIYLLIYSKLNHICPQAYNDVDKIPRADLLETVNELIISCYIPPPPQVMLNVSGKVSRY